jgi:CRISPR system Cascade subunit CasA
MKRFNLLFDPWIPVKTRQGGKISPIKAYEIVQKDIVALDAPRADLNAALMQFLIGLLQTVLAPKNPRNWRILFNRPPSEDELKRKFKKIEAAFYLDGDSYRFMQDISIKGQGNTANVIKLIPGIVGDNTVKKNQDFFLKFSQLSKMSVSNLIAGLYLYQNYCLSETGGKKGRHHGSFRGRNTIIAIVMKESASLWENLWLNVIQDSKFKKLISSDLNDYSFSWMSDSPNCKKNTDSDMAYRDIYWSMPRRVWINFAELKNGVCDLTSEKTEIMENIYIKENGIEYETKLAQHPLIPYRKDTEGVYPIKLTGEGITYGDWLAIVGNDTASENLLENVGRNLEGKFKILVCGYLNHSQQAKTLCWYQTKLPLYGMSLTKELQTEIVAELGKYILSSKKIANSNNGYLSVSIRMAWFGYDYWKEQEKKKDKKPDPLFNKGSRSLYNQPVEIAKCFLNNTESRFYELMKTLNENAHQLTDGRKVELRREWYQHIKREAEKLFNRWAFKSKIQSNPRLIATAHNQLMQNLNSESLKQEILGLPKEV